jgi:peptidoglycan/LPS O-acetylase OafA/YrhL
MQRSERTAVSHRPATEPTSSPCIVRQQFPHQPALDGIRAVAVVLVLLFHAGLPFVTGGYLGVSVFFTLSGYLITSLLLVEHARTGTIRVGAFYGRRVKRLLPASTLCIAGVIVARQFGAYTEVADLQTDVMGSVLQVFNWVQLAGSGSYGDLFGSATSPLEHYWSLAIEEQFYWLWPVVMLALVRWARRTKGDRNEAVESAATPASADADDTSGLRLPASLRRRLTMALLAATLVLSAAAPVIAHVAGPDAAYWSTPARLPEILIGAVLAVVLHRRRVPANAARLALPSLGAILVASMVLPADRGPAYDGWLPAFALVSAVLVYSMQTDSIVRRVLSSRPLVSIGTISYGLYLFHWPVFVLLRDAGWDLTSPPDLLGALAITVALSLVSYRLVERPVRRTSWHPVPTLRLAAMTTVAVLASGVLVAPGAPAIQADDELLDAAAIAPVDDTELTPLVPSSTAATPSSVPAPGPSSTVVGSASAAPAAAGDPSGSTPTELDLPPMPPRPVRMLVVGDSTALYVAHGLAAWSTDHPDHAQVSVSWCQGCTFVLDAEISSFDLDDVLDNSRRTITEVMPEAIADLQPDVVVLMTTVSDAADREWNADEGPLAPTDPRARDRIVETYADLTMEIIASGVADVVWVVPPAPTHDWDDAPEMNGAARYAAHHQIIRDATRRFERHVSVVDLDAWARAAGRFDDDTWRADGVHIDEEPATDLAEQFLGPWLVAEALEVD